jgi:hypothetical protein
MFVPYLIKKGVGTAVYVRNEQNVKDLFKNELNSGHLTRAASTYSFDNTCTKAIQRHTRLFFLVGETIDKPVTMFTM